jgi:hypothetical protein
MTDKNKDKDNEDNEIMTVEYAWKTNRKGLYRALTDQINEKLNQAIQGLEYQGMIDPIVLYFSCHAIARHFYSQLKTHGWNATLDPDEDIIQVDVVASIDKMSKGAK